MDSAIDRIMQTYDLLVNKTAAANAEAREKWNEGARSRATELETRGLEALSGRSREMQEAMGHHASAQGLAHAARGMLAQKDSRVIDALGSIAVPTLVVVGDKDEPFVARLRSHFVLSRKNDSQDTKRPLL